MEKLRRERKTKPFNSKEVRNFIALGLLSLSLVGCGPKGVVNGVKIDSASACETSTNIVIPPDANYQSVIIFGKEFPIKDGLIKGFDLNPLTGELVAEAGDVNGDGKKDKIKGIIENGVGTFHLSCGSS